MTGPTHKYEQKLLEMQLRGEIPLGRVSQVDIYHDDCCRIHDGGYCNCDPDLQVQPRNPPPPGPSVN
jgi:hypothetical protein